MCSADRRAACGAWPVGVRVPSPQETAAYFRELLEFETAEGGRETWHLLCAGEYGATAPSAAITLRPGDALEVSELTFEVGSPHELEDLHAYLAQAGQVVEPVGADNEAGPGIAVRDPSGVVVQCRLPGADLQTRLRPSALRPRRLGHVNLKMSEPGASARFFIDTLGLRLSDQVGDLLFFLRVSSEHHNLGLRGGAERVNVHHIGMEIHGWESFRSICDHIAACGRVVEYGPGRHGPGNNLFVYVVEPRSGLRLELYADMVHIHDELAYQPTRWETPSRYGRPAS